jgi:hypothetical protein
MHIIIIYTRGACAFTERTAFLVLLSRSARRKHAHANKHTRTHTHIAQIYEQTRINKYTRRRMAFRRTHLSHQQRHESWQKIICNAAIAAVAASFGGIERNQWRSAPAPGCPPLTRCAQRRPCQGRTLCDARCTPHESNRYHYCLKKNTRLLIWYLYNIMCIRWLIQSENKCFYFLYHEYGCVK